MLSAVEARRQSRKNFEEKNKVILDEIERNIQKAIIAGKFDMTSDGDLSQEVQTALRGLGYRVDVGCQYNQSYYTISWK